MYIFAALLIVAGAIKIVPEMMQLRGSDKVMPLGRLFYAIPLAVFGTEHFTATTAVAAGVPKWMPFPLFWVYLVGAAFICAGLSIVSLVQARLAATLVAITFLIFVLTIDIPGVLSHPDNRFFWALAFRQLAFSGGALALAMLPAMRALPRFFVGIPALFYGVEHLLHPEYMPGVPLKKLSPDWIPGRIVLSYFVGLVLILAGACLLINWKSRFAATFLGVTILLAVLWIDVPWLLAAPKDVVAMNYLFDTLMFSGTILLLANAETDAAPARELAPASA